MTEAVLDSSVILAILRDETIDQAAYSLVSGGVMSTVNVAEVYGKLAELGLQTAESLEKIDLLFEALDRIEPFTRRQARSAGLLREPTRHACLSLGDRACLALAIDLGADVYTVDQAWQKLDLGIPIHILR